MSATKKQQPKAVLGRSNLLIVHEDIAATTLPSWIGRVPNNLGSASHGTLSADEWRTACTVHLVTSMARLWGSASSSEREHAMLENFMYLVNATKLAHMRVQTASRIEEYQRSMSLYLEGMCQLYPGQSLKPSHHLSLHYPRFLRLYGPVHSWRCFPFERYNYLLQQINTNGKFGEWSPVTDLCGLTHGRRRTGNNYVRELLCRSRDPSPNALRDLA